MKKILIFGPIGDFGGREVESGFIAKVLSSVYDVTVCSTGKMTKKSQVFDFNPKQKTLSLPDMMLKKYFHFRIFAFFSLMKNNFAGKAPDYAKNYLSLKFNYTKKLNDLIENLIPEYDLLFICAQIASAYIPESVAIASKKNIKIVFRTTGVITNIDYGYLSKVDCFIHHSVRNANRLAYSYMLIDQCALNEDTLLKIQPVSKQIQNFLTVSRLVQEKNVDVVIKAFLKSKAAGDKLYVIGDGPQKNELMQLAAIEEDVIFPGLVDNDKIAGYFAKTDCMIVSHYDFETGPLTGIEAMAAGRIIISAKTGAMQDRLPFSNLWFDNNASDLAIQILKAKKLDSEEVADLSNAIQARYIDAYNTEIISKRYLACIKALIS